MVARKIRVLVADGSVVERERITALLCTDPEIQVVGQAARSAGVVEAAKRLYPDIIVLDACLPGEGGFEITKEIMIETPAPVVIVSDETDARQVEASILALRAGALAVVARPLPSHNGHAVPASQHFISTIKAMSHVKVVRHWRQSLKLPPVSRAALPDAPPLVVAIAASTGGPAALQQVLSELPGDFPAPILVVQHIASGFVDGLVNWLNALCSLKVKVAVQAEQLQPHTVYVAPDGSHLGVSGRSRILLSAAEPIGGFRPSATFLFESVAQAFGASSLHVILTGMGQDGVVGLKAARASGARIVAQDEASSVVFGMPGAAIGAGVVDSILPLTSVAGELLATMRGKE